MRVQKHSGGGRGEYELAEAHGAVTPAALLGLELHADWGPFHLRRSGLKLILDEKQGKYRLRTSGGCAHFPIQLAVGLLLPHAIRDEKRLEAGPVLLLAGNYLVSRIELKSVVKLPDRADIAFEGIEVTNNSGNNNTINFDQRLAKVVDVHARRERLPGKLRDLIDEHRHLLETNRPITRKDERIVREVMAEVEDISPDYGAPYIPGADPLPALEQMVGDVAEPSYEIDNISIDSIPEEQLELRRRIASRVQRLVAIRGPKSVKFRREVTKAYGFRCIVCGMRFPKSRHCPVPGVDAAHILAWSDIDLDEISNGLCLCKMHHWAFDQYLISIHWDAEAGQYRIEVSALAALALGGDAATLAALQSLGRVIPREWLPKKRAHWPHQQVLATRINQLLPPGQALRAEGSSTIAG